MTQDSKPDHSVPSDLKQLPIVWKYELLKYLRSKRLLAALVLAAVVLGLLYMLPPALGSPYTGTDSAVELYVVPSELMSELVPGGTPFEGSVAMINRSQIDTETLHVYLNGTEHPSGPNGANWFLLKVTFQGQNVYLVIFTQDVFSSEVAASYDWYTSPQNLESFILNFASILVVVCATFFGADALVSEFQSRTGYLIFPNPVKRWVLFFGKYAASVTASMLVLMLFYTVLAGLSFYTCRGVDDDYMASFGLASMFLVATVAVGYLISSMLKGSTGAIVITFFLFIMGFPMLDGISAFTGTKIDASLTFASNSLIYILIDPYPTDWTQEFTGGITIGNFYPEPATAVLVMLGYTVIALALSLVLFKRKQLVG